MASAPRMRLMKKTGPVNKVVATKHAKSVIKEVIKDVMSESEEVHSVASSDDEVPPIRKDIMAFSTFKQQLLHDCSTTDAELDLSGGNSLSNWWSDTDDEDKDVPKPGLLRSLGSTVSTQATLGATLGSTQGPREEYGIVLESAPPCPNEEKHRRSFYLALRKADCAKAVAQLQASLPLTMECQTLHAQVTLALDFLREAEFARSQLWTSFYRSPGRAAGYCDETPAGAAGQTQRILRQARHVLDSLPAVVAAQWDARTSADVLGRLSFAPPVRLLASLCDTVEGTPSLRGPTECMKQALVVA